MKPSTVFAVGYFVGTAAGMPTGAWLPWWFSGAPAWVLGFIAWHGCYLGPSESEWEWEFTRGEARRTGERLRALDMKYRHANRCLALGLFWGAMSGASATAMPQVLGALVWPGHDDAGLGIVVATLTALGWLVGALLEPDDAPAIRPGTVGLGLYLVFVATCALPALWEVL